MANDLHSIDRPDGGYNKKELEGFMVFCILDTAVPYEMVCKVYDRLHANGMVTREGLKLHSKKMITKVLHKAGYRFPNQHADRLKKFGDNTLDLRECTRRELVTSVSGVGMKLASFFLRNTRDEDYAVLDVHTERWLAGTMMKVYRGKIKAPRTYEEKEKYFKEFAKAKGMTTKELDLEIWQKNRIGNRSKK